MATSEDQDIRWHQRHANYSKILSLLNSNVGSYDLNEFGELELIGLAKSFELTFELMWKLIKDYLEYEEVEIGVISPKNVLRAAGTSGLLEAIGSDGDVLMAAHRTRNELTHVYDEAAFRDSLREVQATYLADMLLIDEYFRHLRITDG
jgi:nucleotidyltransferase substrate binding protein (TIGR01987 family)